MRNEKFCEGKIQSYAGEQGTLALETKTEPDDPKDDDHGGYYKRIRELARRERSLEELGILTWNETSWCRRRRYQDSISEDDT